MSDEEILNTFLNRLKNDDSISNGVLKIYQLYHIHFSIIEFFFKTYRTF